jgi:hypothetical protein
MKATAYHHSAEHIDCEIGVHGNGFLATVRIFMVSTVGSIPRVPEH